MEILPLKYYKSAKYEYALHGAVPFTSSIANKRGVMILIETKKGVKFGAFFSAAVPFRNAIEESHVDDKAILFNISSEITFPV
jgi:hypothetical protein